MNDEVPQDSRPANMSELEQMLPSVLIGPTPTASCEFCRKFLKSVEIWRAAISFQSPTFEGLKFPIPAATGKDAYSSKKRPTLTLLRMTTLKAGTPRAKVSLIRLQRPPARESLKSRLSIPSVPVPDPKDRNPGSKNPLVLAVSIH